MHCVSTVSNAQGLSARTSSVACPADGTRTAERAVLYRSIKGSWLAVMNDVVVTGAGGFIGGHLVKSLLHKGYRVRAVDIKSPSEWHQLHGDDVKNIVADCRNIDDCRKVLEGGADEVYNLACDMGGMGYIETHRTDCMLSVAINTSMLQASVHEGVERYFYSSSACVYPSYRQDSCNVLPLKESDAYPADPEDGYGWEKLFSERMCKNFSEDRGIVTRVARYHNIYGPYGTWNGGREKAPAAICRKVATARLTGSHEIEIWGDGEQRRSFTFISDCVYGTELIARGHYAGPLNLGSSTMVSINELVTIVEEISGIKLKRKYVEGHLGVRGRNSDNELIQREFSWQPATSLQDGLLATYRWIHDRVAADLR